MLPIFLLHVSPMEASICPPVSETGTLSTDVQQPADALPPPEIIQTISILRMLPLLLQDDLAALPWFC
jgi:hypothetical protein